MINKKLPYIASIQYRDCFTSQEILDYKTGSLTPDKRKKVFHHLNVEKCPRCRELYLSLPIKQPSKMFSVDPNKKSEPKLSGYTLTLPTLPETLTKGQLWTTDPEPKNRQGQILGQVSRSMPVLIFYVGDEEQDFDTVLRVFPLSQDVEFHYEPWTYYLNENRNPLNNSFLVEIFNERPMLAGNLKTYLGKVAESELQGIEVFRESFVQSEVDVMDEEFIEWQQKEIELAEFLSFPVNEMLWQDEEVEEAGFEYEKREIELLPYAKAADVTGISLEDINPYVLAQEEHFSLVLIQKRDQVFLEFQSQTVILEDIFLNRNKGEIEKKENSIWVVLLGNVEQIPSHLEIKLIVGQQPYLFHLRFSKTRDG